MKYQRKGGPVEARQYIGIVAIDLSGGKTNELQNWINTITEFEDWLLPISEKLGIIPKYSGSNLILNEYDDLDYSFDTVVKPSDWIVYENGELKVYSPDTFNLVFEEVK